MRNGRRLLPNHTMKGTAMAKKPNRQVTPSLSRIWVYGVVSTAIASGLNLGWLYLCDNIFHWSLQLPQDFDPKVLVAASVWRIGLATGIAGLVATLVSVALSKLVIGPRIWWFILGAGVGLVSIYGALTLPGVDTGMRIRLSVMHIVAMILIVPALARALAIKDVDHAAADRRYHAQLDAIAAQESASALITRSDATINATQVVPAFDVNGLVGKSEDAATISIEDAAHEVRVISRDGQTIATTRDYRIDRINLAIDNGIVTSASIG